MELVLNRTYYPDGTNGEISHKGETICFSIELPWLENRTGVSCIPEGVYPLIVYPSPTHGEVLMLTGVKNRNYILFHPANFALKPKKQLKGCIAPVTVLDKKLKGVGWDSGKATKKLFALVAPRLEKKEEVFLRIQSNN